jgi:hypothetical protein
MEGETKNEDAFTFGRLASSGFIHARPSAELQDANHNLLVAHLVG